MGNVSRVLGGSMVAVLCSGAPAGAQSGRCSSDALTFDGGTVTATFCASPVAAGRATVTETFARGSASFSKTTEIAVLPGAEVTRTVDDVSLQPLGSAKRLRLTLAFREGTATLEHAMLLPGAVVLK